METIKPLFKEYTNKEEALDVIRQMKAEGIEDIETCDLKPVSREPSDVGLAPRATRSYYEYKGLWIGAFIGFVVSNIIFMVPAFVLRFVHASLIGGLGVAICTAACGIIGFAMSFAYSKRVTREPASGRRSAATLGVTVEAENVYQEATARRLMKLDPVLH